MAIGSDKELLYQLALALVPNIGLVQARILVQHYGSASSIFKAKQSELEKIEGIGTIRASSIKKFDDFKKAEKEIAFVERYNIRTLFLTDPDYPQRFLNCYDPPSILFFKGDANLNASRMVSFVGTRKNTQYGKEVTEKMIEELAEHSVTIVSGLAFGIDTIAHKCSIKHNIPTIGALGHGLDIIYPQENTALAKSMIKEGGGLISEFYSGTKPDKHNFPMRNRIVAGLCDATVIIETDIKGGSMITAEVANSYNRDVFAIPGKITDNKSAGSNHLIRTNKAVLLTEASQLVEMMGWEEKAKPKLQTQKKLFLDLTPEENKLIELFSNKPTLHIDEINLTSGISTSAAAVALLNLELNGIIATLPGKFYKILS